MEQLPYAGPGNVYIAEKRKGSYEFVNEEEAIITIPTRVNIRELWESTFYNCNSYTSPWVHCCEEKDFHPNATVELWIENPDWDDRMYTGEEPIPRMVWSWHDLPEEYKEQSVLKMWATVDDLVKAYTQILADRKRHCGEHVTIDPTSWDSCVTDYMIQYMFFGKLIYG